MWGMLAKLAGPLIGGLVGSRENRRQEAAARQDDFTRFTRLREGAEAAGFNPLTALMYGGTSSAMPSVAPISLSSFVRDGFEAASDEITGAAAQRRAGQRLQNELSQLRIEQARAELAAFNTRPAALSAGAGLGRPGRVTVGPVSFADDPVILPDGRVYAVPSDQVSAGQGGSGLNEVPFNVRNPARTSVDVLGVSLAPGSGFSDAQEWQQRYGEPGEWFGGAVNMVSDGIYNVGRLADNTVGAGARWLIDNLPPLSVVRSHPNAWADARQNPGLSRYYQP